MMRTMTPPPTMTTTPTTTTTTVRVAIYHRQHARHEPFTAGRQVLSSPKRTTKRKRDASSFSPFMMSTKRRQHTQVGALRPLQCTTPLPGEAEITFDPASPFNTFHPKSQTFEIGRRAPLEIDTRANRFDDTDIAFEFWDASVSLNDSVDTICGVIQVTPVAEGRSEQKGQAKGRLVIDEEEQHQTQPPKTSSTAILLTFRNVSQRLKLDGRTSGEQPLPPCRRPRQYCH